MNLVEKIRTEIDHRALIPAGSAIAVGVSGGADSVALLHVLHRLGYPLLAVHLNHGIRGTEADADEAFVQTLCSDLGVECVSRRTDVPALASTQGLSLEMAAREARHRFFRSVLSARFSQPAVLCLAHHADDQIELFFLRAARGTGPDGLGGMRFSRTLEGLTLVRPLLGIRRTELIDWLKENQMKWREDASNADQAVPRNRVRHRILPMLETLNERAAENILRTMTVLRDEIDDPARAARRREIRDWLIGQSLSPDFNTVERVIDFAAHTDGSRSLDLKGLRIINEYGKLRLEATSPPRVSIQMKEGAGILRGPWKASVSQAELAGRELLVRAARPGDRIHPYGMDGSKKLQDIFTDLKIPVSQRARWPVVECDGEIVWVPGYRIASGWELASETEPALHLSVEPISGS